MDRRKLIEVVKWAHPRDVLQNYAQVCVDWQAICDLDELWESFADLLPAVAGKARGRVTKAFYRHLRQRLLPVLQPSTFRLYDCVHRRFAEGFEISMHVDPKAAVLLLDLSILFICGGLGSRDVLCVAPPCVMQPLMPMHCERAFHSILYYKQKVLVFGGLNGRFTCLKTAECMNLRTRSVKYWQKLPEMHSEHSACYPCREGEKVYLCGGNTRSCEVFNLDSETFSVLPFSLPESHNGCACFHYLGDLVVVLHHYCIFWNETAGARVRINQRRYPIAWTGTQQRRLDHMVYSATQSSFREFNLRTLTWKHWNW